MTDIKILKIPEELLGLLGLGLSPIVIIVIGIIILIWAILWFVVPFYVYGIWRRIKNIEAMINQQVRGRHPDYSPKLMKRPATGAKGEYEGKEEIDEETKKILEEMDYHRKVEENKED